MRRISRMTVLTTAFLLTMCATAFAGTYPPDGGGDGSGTAGSGASAGAGGDSLASTGSDTSWLVYVGITLLVVGLIATVVTTRRRRAVHI